MTFTCDPTTHASPRPPDSHNILNCPCVMMQFESNAIIPHDPIIVSNNTIREEPRAVPHVCVSIVNHISYLYVCSPKASIKDFVNLFPSSHAKTNNLTLFIEYTFTIFSIDSTLKLWGSLDKYNKSNTQYVATLDRRFTDTKSVYWMLVSQDFIKQIHSLGTREWVGE